MEPQNTEAFKATKMGITSASIMKYYDPRMPLTLQTDISLEGLGAAFSEEINPIIVPARASSHTKNYTLQLFKSQKNILISSFEKNSA